MLNSFQVDLIKAIEGGSLDDIRKLVIGKFDIDKPLIPLHDIPVQPNPPRTPFPMIRGPTPLVLAILHEKTQIIEYFIKDKNANLSVDVGGLYPIHYACIMGNIDIINIIIAKDPTSVNKLNKFNYSPVHVAAANNHTKAVLLLLKNGASPNIENKQA